MTEKSLKSPVRFVDLPAQYADLEEKIVQGIAEIIHKGAFVGGAVLSEFERNLADYVGTKFAVCCSDGTSALKLALLGAGIEPGNGVIVPANSFIASAFAVTHAGGRPLLVDCDKHTYLIDLNQAEDLLKSRRAEFVMPVHLYGNPCPMREILEMAEKYNAKIIEDNAQAIGAEVDGRKTGSFGIAAGVSFYPAKNLGAFGQGGALLTNSEGLAEKARMYLEQGQGKERYYHRVVGYNDRLHSIQASVLDALLPKLDGFNTKRLQCADGYASRLPASRIQQRTPNSTPAYHLFEFRCDSPVQREKLADALKEDQIGFGYHYPVPIHKQEAYPGANALSFPVSESLAETLISLPIHPSLEKVEVDQVCGVIEQVMGGDL